MTARNDVTGDNIQTKTSTQAYRDGWDQIFGKKSKDEAKVIEEGVDQIQKNMDNMVGQWDPNADFSAVEKEWLNLPDVGNERICSCAGSNGAPCICK